jgi:hypothetical protein
VYWNGSSVTPDGSGNQQGDYGYNWYIDDNLQTDHSNSLTISS